MEINTIGERLYWSYANLAMSHSAVTAKAEKFSPVHFMIRAKLFKGLKSGDMNLGALADDERLKMILPQSCCYCGSREDLAADHLIPKKKGGANTSDNLVWACKPCNSSKNATDVLVWLNSRNQFPSILLLRRYLKLAIGIAQDLGIVDLEIENAHALPFELNAIPMKYPKPSEQKLWIVEF